MAEAMGMDQLALWGKLKNKRIPVLFDMEITARCNLNCRHCYINLPAADCDAKARELSVAEIMDIARQAVNMGALSCLLTGGEPLLRDDFEDIYIGLKRLGLLVSIFTNATLIDDRYIKLFSKYPPRDMEVTVYGVTRDTYEAITRRKGSFESFIKGLDKLRSGGHYLRLKTMAMQSNYHEQQAISEYCLGKTRDFYRFDPQLHLRYDGDARRNDEIKSERLTPQQIVTLEKADKQRFNSLCNNCDSLIRENRMPHDCGHLFYCGTGNVSFIVSYDGRFRLCHSLCADGTTYDLKSGTLAEAWHVFVPQVRNFSSRRKKYQEHCHKCTLLNLCFWCPAHAHLETGQLDGFTPYFCEVAHKRAESIKTAVHGKEV